MESRDIPIGYSRIDYLIKESVGCIETGVFPSLDFKLETKIEVNNVSDDYFCSCRKDSLQTRYYILNINNKWGFVCSKSSWPSAHYKPNNFLNTPHIIKSITQTDRVSITVDDECFEFLDNTQDISDKTLPLFGAKLNNSDKVTVFSQNGTKLYYAKMWSNGALKRDFVPVVKDEDNTGWLFDRVSRRMFGNANDSGKGFPNSWVGISD